MDTPDLVIPMRLDNAPALRGLFGLEERGEAAGEAVAKGAKKGQAGMASLGETVVAIGKSLLSLQLIEQVGQAVGDQFKKAADHVKQLALEFKDLRQALQQVAALTGKENSNQFTVEQVEAATRASLSPEEWKGFQEQFQSYGGAYLEGDQARFVDRGNVTAARQAEEYQQKIAEFAKARGINANEAAQLGGGLLQFSEGPQTTKDLMSRYGKVFKTLERAPTPVSQLLPQMSRVMAQGASPEEAAQLLALASEFMPGEEETAVTNTIKAITNQVLEGKGDKLGQKKGMGRLEQVKAAVATIKERVAGGEDLDKILHEVAPDLRESRGMKGFLTRGVEAEGFKRVKGYVEETPEDWVDTELTKYEQSDAGRQAKRDAQERLAKVKVGAKYDAAMAARQEARTELIEKEEYTGYGIDEGLRKFAGLFTGQSPEEQREGELALRKARKRAKQVGVSEEEAQRAGVTVDENALDLTGRPDSAQKVNTELLELLKLIAEHTKPRDKDAVAAAPKQAAREAQQFKVQAPLPAAAPPRPRAPM
jgi:hypothetical protein